MSFTNQCIRVFVVIFTMLCHAVFASETTSNPSNASSKISPVIAKSAADIPAHVFLARAFRTDIHLAPDGNKFAAIDLIDKRLSLVVYDVLRDKQTVVARFSDGDIRSILWVNNDRLLVFTYSIVEQRPVRYGYSLVTVNADGTDLKMIPVPQLWSPRQTNEEVTTTMSLARALLNGTPEEIIVNVSNEDTNGYALFQYNLITLKTTRLTPKGLGHVNGWLLDANDKPVFVIIRGEKIKGTQNYKSKYLRMHDDKWVEISHLSQLEGDYTISPVALDGDNKSLYAISRHGKDRYALYKYDLIDAKMPELVYEHPTRDFYGSVHFTHDNKTLLGVQHEAERPVIHWFDQSLRTIQANIDRALPNTINLLKTKNTSNRFMLVFSLSETEPGVNYLYDREKKQLELLNLTRPWLPTAMLAKREHITFRARDGLLLQAWVTKPKASGAEKLPLIVHINPTPTGSFLYGADGYDQPTAQFLASRGYVVIETLTRGAYGYGKKFLDAGRNEIGRKMQDDIADAALHLSKSGLVDPARMCLLGMQYGGYAALNAIVRDPELWRCASAYGTPTELKTNATTRWIQTIISDFESTQQAKNLSERDSLLKQLSPMANVDKFKGAVRLSHDAGDKALRVRQSQDFFEAMKDAGKDIELKIYEADDTPQSGHRRFVDFIKESELFFAKQLKPRANIAVP